MPRLSDIEVSQLAAVGVGAYEKGDYDCTIKCMLKVIDNEPKHWRAKLYLGMAYLRQGDKLLGTFQLRFVKTNCPEAELREQADKAMNTLSQVPAEPPSGQFAAQRTSGQFAAQRATGQFPAQPAGRATGQYAAASIGQPTSRPSGQYPAPPLPQPTAQLEAQRATGQFEAQRATGQFANRPAGQPAGQPLAQAPGQPIGQPAAGDAANFGQPVQRTITDKSGWLSASEINSRRKKVEALVQTAKGQRFPLGPTNTIGKNYKNTIRLIEDRTIGDFQAVIVFEDQEFWIENSMDSNPTRVNGRPVTERTRLRPGDEIRMGQTIFKVE
jgi:hypothetical protein